MAELGQRGRDRGASLQHHLGDAAAFAEGDCLAEDVERCPRSLVGPDDPAEVAVDHGRLASQVLFERKLERPAQVLEPVGVPKGTAGNAAPVERECGLGEVEL